MNAMNGQTSVNLLVNNSTVASGVAYGTASGYNSSPSGSQPVEIQGAGTPVLNQTVTINGGSNNTLLATNNGLTVFTDNKTTPSAGNIQMRVINASQSINPSDVYIVPSSNPDISSVNPNFPSLAFQAASPYSTMAAGGYEIIFTAVGQKIALITVTQSFSAGEIRTIVSLDDPSPFGTILADLN